MDEQRVMHVIEDEAMAVVDRVMAEDKIVLSADDRTDLVQTLRRGVGRVASQLTGETEDALRSAVGRMVRTKIAALRPS